MRNTVIITRHPGLVEYLREIGLADERTTVLHHCSDPEQIENKHVLGPLPLHLAAVARSVVHIPLRLAPGDRGRELTLEEVRERAGAPEEYLVRREPSGYLRGLSNRAEIQRAWPGADGPVDAVAKILAAWAAEHGLVSVHDRDEEVPPRDGIEAMCRMTEIPAPPYGSVCSVHWADGRARIAVRVAVGNHQTWCSYVRAAEAEEVRRDA